jgi:FkbM family methyltransferase
MSFVRTVAFILSHPLARRRPIASLAAYVKWQVGSRLVPGPVVCPWVDRSRILVHRGETGLTGNIYAGLHEFTDMAFLLHLLRQEDLFVDVGANVGAYSVLACAATAARGVAFEPVPSTYSRLLDNVRLNRAESRVQCINMAVADVPGSIAFSSADDTTNHALAAGERRGDAIDVEVTTLDSALAGYSPTLIKIDVEGYETLVVRGGERTLAAPSLLAVIMELNGNGKRYGFDDEQLVNRMAGLGFAPCVYEPFSRHLGPLEERSENTGNIIFVRDYDAVNLRLRTAKSANVHGIKL